MAEPPEALRLKCSTVLALTRNFETLTFVRVGIDLSPSVSHSLGIDAEF